MANASPQKDDVQTVRIPFLSKEEYRNSTASKDQRFVNGFFEPVVNQIKKSIDYFYVKRPGLSQNIRPPGANAVGRGIHQWRGDVYSVFGTKLYKNTTDLGVTLTTSTGRCDFAATRPGAAVQYLCMNDGARLYCIDTAGAVIVLTNITITSSSVANPTVITTATPHGLLTGNKVKISGHTGSSPAIDGLYSITVTGASTFTIPVNVTVGGTGGNIGAFPVTNNTSDLVYMDGYLFTLDTYCQIWNCEVDDPTTWNPTKYITAQMQNGSGVGLGRQNNVLVCFSDINIQTFYDAANSTGSPLTNIEQTMHQVGCASQDSISHVEDDVYFVGNGGTGGFSVWKLSGTADLKDIGDPQINRIINLEGSNLSSATGFLLRTGGHVFYVLKLIGANRTFVYDPDIDMWLEWEAAAGDAAWPVTNIAQQTGGALVQDSANGWIYNISTSTYQDNGSNFTVLARTSRVDFDTLHRKYCSRLDLIGDKQASTANVSIQYSDDDYNTLSTARTFDMSQTRTFGTQWGNFRRRSWQASYAGALPIRWVGIEIDVQIGDQ